MKKEVFTAIDDAIEFILENGQVDGAHHKAWVIDQTLKILAGKDYEEYVSEYENEGEYSWRNGIAP